MKRNFHKIDLNVTILLPVTFHIFGNISRGAFEKFATVTLIRLGFLKVVFSGRRSI